MDTIFLILTLLSNPQPEPVAFLWCVGLDGAEGSAPGKNGECPEGTKLYECPDDQPVEGELHNCRPARNASAHEAVPSPALTI